jgi:hypothetical protein
MWKFGSRLSELSAAQTINSKVWIHYEGELKSKNKIKF